MKEILKESSIIVGTTLGVGLNYFHLIPPLLGNARNLDHLLAGMGIPYIYGLITKPIEKYFDVSSPNKFGNYLVWATFWESSQAIKRGYFQADQFAWDMIGIGLAYTLDKIWINKKLKRII